MQGALLAERIDFLNDFEAFDAMLARPGPWVGAFDFPLGLPRELVEALGWPTEWGALIDTYAATPRPALQAAFDDFRRPRPEGGKFAHRACDRWSGASSSMKTVNPPVAWMLHAGAPRLKRAGVAIPSVRWPGRAGAGGARVALEGYPGLVARAVTRASYKNDARSKQTPARRVERQRIVTALEAGATRFGPPVRFAAGLAETLLDDATGDALDAVLCLLLAHWGWVRSDADWGMPADLDPLEGWIAGAVPA